MLHVLLFYFVSGVFSRQYLSVDCTSLPQADYPFCNPGLTPATRAWDLVSRLTTEELYGQCGANAESILRLGINKYNWRSNCLHGWAKSGGQWPEGVFWTNFPTPLGLGASFDVELLQKVGEVTADEGRALHNIMLLRFNGSSTEGAGLNCFSPNVNLFRDPRWGRGQESFSEDPFHLSVMGVAYTKGLQEGEDPKYLKIAACAKHFAVHSGPEDIRNHFTANVSLHDLYDTFLPAFKSQLLVANVAQIMTALSGTRTVSEEDGAPDVANLLLLKTILRGEFNQQQLSTISDNGAIGQVYTAHHYVSSEIMAAAVCMNATTDLDLIYDNVYLNYLPEAVKSGLVSMENVKAAVWRSFLLRIRTGDFDPYDSVPYQHIDESHLDTEEHQQLNLESVHESIVLLKNSKSALPLNAALLKNVAVLGPLANATDVLLANYIGMPSKVVSVLRGLKDYNKIHLNSSINFYYSPGCENASCSDTSRFDEALLLAKESDIILAVMGLDGTLEGEGHDRKNTSCNNEAIDVLALPGCQSLFLSSLLKVKSNIILILVNGGPLSIPEFYKSNGIVAIIETFYPGALGGVGIANVLFGSYNPAGRMPVTTLLSSSDLRDSVDYRMHPYPGRTYRYFRDQTLFPFGYGLSFTTFHYMSVAVQSKNIKFCEQTEVIVTIMNTGEMSGDEVIQVYILFPKEARNIESPYLQLVGFKRVKNVQPLEKQTIQFFIFPYQMSLVVNNGKRYIYPGEYMLSVGGRSPGYSVVGNDNNIVDSFVIEGVQPFSVDNCNTHQYFC